MRKLAKTAIAAFCLASWPICFAQQAATTGQQEQAAGAATTAPPQELAQPAKPGRGAIPIPRSGDPFYAPIASRTPLTFHQRFANYSRITFGPRSLFTPVFGSAIAMANPPSGYPREWRQGMGAFGRIYGSHLATRTSEQTARFLTAAVLHEDFRYRPSASKNPFVRSAHALAFTFVDKSDGGHNTLAFSNFASSAAAGFTPNLYLPDRYSTTSRADTRMAFAFGGLAVQNLAREFAPEMFKVTRKLHLPFPRVPIPDWWTGKR
jgi:hypothetical protein